MLSIVGHPRLHIALADMAFATPRWGGGAGFSIDGHETILTLRTAETFHLSGTSKIDELARRRLLNLVEGLERHIQSNIAAHVDIVQCPPQHIGFGTGTSLSLALLAGINHLLDLGLRREELQILSGRGGLSGIGIHAFFEGGLICDGGHRNTNSPALLSAPIQPSGAVSPSLIPPLLTRCEVPRDWRICLLYGSDSKGIFAAEERTFFKYNTPVGRDEAFETIANIYHGIFAGFRTCDIASLSTCLTRLHKIGFKARELTVAGPAANGLISDLHHPVHNWLAAGLSSVGPLVYVVHHVDDTANASELLHRLAQKYQVTLTSGVSGWNSGYELQSHLPGPS